MRATNGCGCGCRDCGTSGLRGSAEYMVARSVQPPQFGHRMSFAAALSHNDANNVGLYRIYKSGRPIYSGRAAPGTIRNRLIQHRWCLTHLGIDPAPYQVSLGPMRGMSAPQVIAAEKSEIRRMRRNRVFRGTNIREGEMFGAQAYF
ncbi:MAG TPA: hypothetical protein VNI02_14700 [Blastocatellia bacterium]|nr:hypothetical protein [Blastocatellia bacterium]